MMELSSALTGLLAVLAVLMTNLSGAEKPTILLNITSGRDGPEARPQNVDQPGR
jgi:hypothetical protein